jgi:metal transporter CNNM
MEMKIKADSGTPKEKEYSSKLLPIIENHHLLLVTLMLWNASATEALPIFLDKLVPEFVAVIISVTLVLLFGEILPSSLLTGPNQLKFASQLTPLVYFACVLFFPVAYPISKLLDYFIGQEHEVTVYNRQEIAVMLKLQNEEGEKLNKENHRLLTHHRSPSSHLTTSKMKTTHSKVDSIHKDEVMIMGGALKFRDIKAFEVMTSLEKVFMLSKNGKLSSPVSCLSML